MFPVFALSDDYSPNNKNECSQSVEIDEPYLTKVFTLDTPGVLKVSTLAGNVEVVGAENSNKVRVELYVKRGYKLWSSEKNLDNYFIHIKKQNNQIIASAEPTGSSGVLSSSDISFSFVVYVPKEMSTEINTKAGNISLIGLNGTQMGKTGAGNIELQNVNGSQKIYTAAGHITVKQSQGSIKALTNGGHITFENTSGEIRAQTKGGNITAENIGGIFLAETNAGNISARFTYVKEGIRMNSKVGNVKAEIAEGTPLDVVLEANEIEFENRDEFKGKVENNAVSGTFYDGGTILNMITNMGKVELVFYEN